MTSVYISNDKIQVVIGSDSGKLLTIKRIVLEPLESGCMLNGAIINANAIQQHLESMWKANKLPGGVHVVMNSPNVHTKVVETPLLPEAKLRLFLQEEFQDMESEGAPLIDYTVLQPKRPEGGALVLAAHAERTVIGEYISLFTEAKIPVESVNIANSCVIQVMRRMEQYKDKTFILTVFDGSGMMQYLFVNGLFRFAKRLRLMSEFGTPEMQEELARSLSNMIQFNKSEKNQSSITDIFVCGYPADLPQPYGQLREALGVEVSALPNADKIRMNGNALLSDYIYAVGNLLVCK